MLYHIRRYNELTWFFSFLMSMIFYTSVIFLCDFSIINLFQNLSTYDLNDFYIASNKDVDAMIMSITDLDDNETVREIMHNVKTVIYGFEGKYQYEIADAIGDASYVIGDIFDVDLENLEELKSYVIGVVSEYE